MHLQRGGVPTTDDRPKCAPFISEGFGVQETAHLQRGGVPTTDDGPKCALFRKPGNFSSSARYMSTCRDSICSSVNAP